MTDERADGGRPSTVDEDPCGSMEFAFVFAMWTVMMVGMMTPSAMPMILMYARVGRETEPQAGGPFGGNAFAIRGAFPQRSIRVFIVVTAIAVKRWTQVYNGDRLKTRLTDSGHVRLPKALIGVNGVFVPW